MVAPVVAGALIGAGSSLLGGLLSNRANRRTVAANAQAQREFAQQGVRWKVEDARAAGIHPLYALGAQTHSFSPIAVSDSMGPALASAGQDIGRAVQATRTQEERTDRLGDFIASQLERQASRDRQAEQHAWQKVEHDMRMQLLSSQLARQAQQQNPPFPSAVSSAAGPYSPQLPEVQIPNPRVPGLVAGPAAPAAQRYGVGNVEVLGPPQGFPDSETWASWLLMQGYGAAKKAWEDHARSKNLGSNYPPPVPLPPGQEWRQYGDKWHRWYPGYVPRSPFRTR